MPEYKVDARRVGAFNPAELFLTSIAAYTLRGRERVIPMLKVDRRGIEVSLRNKAPASISPIWSAPVLSDRAASPA